MTHLAPGELSNSGNVPSHGLPSRYVPVVSSVPSRPHQRASPLRFPITCVSSRLLRPSRFHWLYLPCSRPCRNVASPVRVPSSDQDAYSPSRLPLRYSPSQDLLPFLWNPVALPCQISAVTSSPFSSLRVFVYAR